MDNIGVVNYSKLDIKEAIVIIEKSLFDAEQMYDKSKYENNFMIMDEYGYICAIITDLLAKMKQKMIDG